MPIGTISLRACAAGGEILESMIRHADVQVYHDEPALTLRIGRSATGTPFTLSIRA